MASAQADAYDYEDDDELWALTIGGGLILLVGFVVGWVMGYMIGRESQTEHRVADIQEPDEEPAFVKEAEEVETEVSPLEYHKRAKDFRLHLSIPPEFCKTLRGPELAMEARRRGIPGALSRMRREELISAIWFDEHGGTF